MAFFVVPTIRFGILYVFFVIGHARRKILHFNVTPNPSSEWVIRQLREAFPFDTATKYLIFDRNPIFSHRVKEFIKSMGTRPKQIACQIPWQNGAAERSLLFARTELLDHVIIFGEDHLRRLLREYVDYYNQDRCHLSLNRDSPAGRFVQEPDSASARIVSVKRVGGLQHRYEWRDAA